MRVIVQYIQLGLKNSWRNYLWIWKWNFDNRCEYDKKVLHVYNNSEITYSFVEIE